MRTNERGMADKTAIIIGVLLILFIMGFFKSNGGLFNKYNSKSLLKVPCGLSLSDISDNDHIKFPLAINGYINGCGWEAGNNKEAGSVQIFDDQGRLVSSPAILYVNEDGENLPLNVQANVFVSRAPQTEKGKVLIRSFSGFTRVVPVSF